MNNRVAVITGSSAGIGYAIAETLAKAGAGVVVNGRSKQNLEEAESAIEMLGGKVLAVQADASTEEGIERIVKETVNYFGRLDILVNNAAMVGVGFPFEMMDIEHFDEVLRTNLRAPFLCAREAVPFLRESPAGRIVNIGGLSSKTPLPFAAADAAAKAGLSALTRVMAAELGPQGVTVNTVIPGFQPDTDSGKAFNERLSKAFDISPEASIDVTRSRTLLKRFESLEEISEAILFLCADAGGSITGQELNVNCGLSTH
ncbi:MAG: SDR family oxidoreductase [Pyrinomonadaceae bacterium]|nr:SDR family oxidoreductase [Pyrinomonadaceae bacterium]